MNDCVVVRWMQVVCCLVGLFCFDTAKAQLCNGSLGDPVVNITFGEGANYGQSLSSTVTNYNYSTVPCFNDGYYIVASSMPSCWADSWYALPEDHTPGDVNGYMMVINASNNPGDFYVKSVSGLCGGVTYEFASWVLNILKPQSCGNGGIKPNITFKIETLTGTVLLTYNTGDILPTNPYAWKQYGAYFTLPAGLSDVVIRMTNNAVGGCGNDLVLDDITFRPCGKLVNVAVNGTTLNYDLCAGDPWNITCTSDAVVGSNTTYQWQRKTSTDTVWTDIPGANGISYTPPFTDVAGQYKFRLAFAQNTGIGMLSCRIVSNDVSVIVNPLPKPSEKSNSPLCEGNPLVLTASGGDLYQWTGPKGFSSILADDTIRQVTKNNAGKYFVKVTSNKGCVAYDSTMVIINANPLVSIITPESNICQGDSILLNATISNANTYQWQPLTALSAGNLLNPKAAPNATTLYTFTGNNANCTKSVGVLINVYPKPVANAGPDQYTLEGVHVQLLGNTNSGNVTVSWKPPLFLSDANVLQPLATPPADTTYTLTLVSKNGCGVSSDNVFVKVYKNIIIPNIFSPNGDGVNDTWKIVNLDKYESAELTVFNRYGQPVYQSYGNYHPWNGTYNGARLPTGTYYYIINIPVTGKHFSGWVVLLK